MRWVDVDMQWNSRDTPPEFPIVVEATGEDEETGEPIVFYWEV